MEPEGATWLGANLLGLASECPLETRFDLAFLALT